MTIDVRHFFKYQFPAIAWAIVIYTLSSIPGTRLPKWTFLHFDKVIHGGFFFILGLFVYRFLEPKIHSPLFNWKRALVSFVIVVGYGILDEFHQSFVPGRTMDVLDATADSIGGILSAVAMFIFTTVITSKTNGKNLSN